MAANNGFPTIISWKQYSVNLAATGQAYPLGSGNNAQTLTYSAFIKSADSNTNLCYASPISGSQFWTLGSGDVTQINAPHGGKFDLNQWFCLNSGLANSAQTIYVLYL